MLFEEMTAQNRQILEDTQAERQERHIVEVDAEAIADVDEKGGHESVHKEARDEYGIVEVVFRRRPQAAENGI